MSITLTCQECGDTFTVPESRADAKYCSRDCFYNAGGGGPPKKPRVTIECASCGDPFEVTPSREDTAKYCSKECLHGKTHERTCAVCGSDFRVSPSRDAVHCSRKCADTGRHRRIDRECVQCGNAFWVHQSNRDQRYCSHACWGADHTGENSPNWNGGTGSIYYGASWETQRKKALERDGHECALCGLPDAAHRDLTGVALHVHHKTPFREFEDHEAANALSNLITVCRSCHLQLDPVSQGPGVTVNG